MLSATAIAAAVKGKVTDGKYLTQPPTRLMKMTAGWR